MPTYDEFSQQFYDEIQDRLVSQASDCDFATGTDIHEDVFTQLMLDHLSELGVVEDANPCRYSERTGKGNIRIDAWAVDESEGAVTLIASRYLGKDGGHITKTDTEQLLGQLWRYWEAATNGHYSLMEPGTEQHAMTKQLHDFRDDIGRVRLILLTDKIFSCQETRKAKHPKYAVSVDYWDMQRLFRCVASELPYESLEINFVERCGRGLQCLPLSDTGPEYRGYLLIFPGELLSELYEEYGSRLLELNVRSFLQAKGKVNKGIRATLKSSPGRFFAFNNGISATAEEVTLAKKDNGETIIDSVRGLQIVNGGQTVASINQARKIDKVDLKRVFVQAKLTVVSPDIIKSLAPDISRFANSQNKVNDADFSSNDPYNVEIQRLSETIWCPGEKSRWFYERARGQYQVSKAKQATTVARKKEFESTYPVAQCFTKTDLAKYVNSWDGYSHLVSMGAQKNFVAFMDRLRGEYDREWKPSPEDYYCLIGKALVFKHADKVARAKDIPAYKANTVAYLVAYLGHRCIGRLSLKDVWDRQEVSEGTGLALEEWCMPIYEHLVASAGQRNVTEWCKKSACWESVKLLNLTMPLPLRHELDDSTPVPTVGKGIGKLNSTDKENIARVMQVPADTWFRISTWGAQSGVLNEWQHGIAHTLSGYAAKNWVKVPSVKQARHAVEILEIAAEHGVLKGDDC